MIPCLESWSCFIVLNPLSFSSWRLLVGAELESAWLWTEVVCPQRQCLLWVASFPSAHCLLRQPRHSCFACFKKTPLVYQRTQPDALHGHFGGILGNFLCTGLDTGYNHLFPFWLLVKQWTLQCCPESKLPGMMSLCSLYLLCARYCCSIINPSICFCPIICWLMLFSK